MYIILENTDINRIKTDSGTCAEYVKTTSEEY